MSPLHEAASPHGIVIVDKPIGPTSFSVMRAVGRQLGAKRVGHAGTLDPAASGILVVLLGEGTKLSDLLMHHDKVYEARVVLGRATDTLDAEGQTVAEAPVPAAALEPAAIRAALPAFLGKIMQVPPVYSALKRDGRTLMSRARAGEQVEVAPREVRVDALELLAVDGPALLLRVACGKGFYVRSLARDLGAALGVPAHLGGLRRTVLGGFTLADAHLPADITAAHVVPLALAVPGFATFVCDAQHTRLLGTGRPVPAPPGAAARALAVDSAARPIALVRLDGDHYRVERGFADGAVSEARPSDDSN